MQIRCKVTDSATKTAFSNGDFFTKYYDNSINSDIIRKTKSSSILSDFYQFLEINFRVANSMQSRWFCCES